jgi:enamine deaminase RidA (YjgF/YER057c/UK114 family)
VLSRETWRDVPLTVHVAGPTDDDIFVTAAVGGDDAAPAEAAARLYAYVAELLATRRMQVVHERLFGSIAVRGAVLDARSEALRRGGLDAEGPLTFVQGGPVWGEGLAGVQMRLVRPPEGTQVETIYEGGVPAGRAWTRSGGRFLMLQDLCAEPADVAGSTRAIQAERMFRRAEAILRSQGADYLDVVRTWIYLSRILEWYDEFNEARNAVYERVGLIGRETLLPASTGIEGDNVHGAASVMDLTAIVRPEGAPVRVSHLGNVRQADAFSYGSAFSRGACIHEPHLKHVHISGTAAVDRKGRTMHVGDARKQMLCTADCVRSLIGQEGASLTDICQATVFFKHAGDYEEFRAIGEESGLGGVPAVYVRADVCRADWLFEIDGVAARATTG